jgi:hypothetical protein
VSKLQKESADALRRAGDRQHRSGKLIHQHSAHRCPVPWKGCDQHGGPGCGAAACPSVPVRLCDIRAELPAGPTAGKPDPSLDLPLSDPLQIGDARARPSTAARLIASTPPTALRSGMRPVSAPFINCAEMFRKPSDRSR